MAKRKIEFVIRAYSISYLHFMQIQREAERNRRPYNWKFKNRIAEIPTTVNTILKR